MHIMLGLANVLLANVGTVEAVYDASALAVKGGVYGVHGMVMLRSDSYQNATKSNRPSRSA